jgi:MerR family mercuric resistance operon transcriptional regulator
MLERLRFIRRAQAVGLSLEDIRQLLGLDRKRACGTTRALAAQRLVLIETKLKDLTILRDALAALIHEVKANADAITQQWPNAFFADLGLFTMSEAHRLARQSRCGNN